MTELTDDQNEEQIRRRKKGESEGEQAGSGVAKLLTTAKRDAVAGEHRHLLGAELIEAVLEFVSEKAVASATLVVTFVKDMKEKIDRNPKAFAVTSWFLDLGKQTKQLALQLTKLRSTDANAVKSKPNGFGTMKPSSGPTGAQ